MSAVEVVVYGYLAVGVVAAAVFFVSCLFQKESEMREFGLVFAWVFIVFWPALLWTLWHCYGEHIKAWLVPWSQSRRETK